MQVIVQPIIAGSDDLETELYFDDHEGRDHEGRDHEGLLGEVGGKEGLPKRSSLTKPNVSPC